MKKKERKELQVKLLVAITKVLLDNKTVLKAGTEKTVKKSIRKITKRSKKTSPVAQTK